MENQGNFNYAIFGDDLNALITAFLLRRQEERVIVIPEPTARSRQGRMLFGYEKKGLIHGLLKRWGVPDDFLDDNVVEEPRVELFSKQLTLSLRGPLDQKSLGSLAFELRGPEGEKFRQALSSLEEQEQWLERFHQDLLEEMRKSHRGARAWLQPARNTARLWSKVLRRNLKATVGASRLQELRRWGQKIVQTSDEIRLLTQGVGSLMGPGRARVDSMGSPLLQVLLEVYAIRRTPFSRAKAEVLTKQLRTYLKQTGVDFIDEREKVHLKRGEGGRWEAFYGDSQKSVKHFSFEHLVFAHSLSERSLDLFEESARKTLEKELREEPSVYIEWSGKLPSGSLPFPNRTELVASLGEFPVVHLSIYGAEDGMNLDPGVSLLSARTLLPDLTKLPIEPEILRQRFERVLSELFSSVDLSTAKDMRFRLEKHRDFPLGSGVKTKNSRIFHVNHASYPRLGEFGPFVAGLDLARRSARKRKKELML